MSTPPTVNTQITDSVTQSNVQVVAEAPAMSMGMLYQMSMQATGISIQNAVHAQQAMNQVSVAVVSSAVNKIMGVETTTK